MNDERPKAERFAQQLEAILAEVWFLEYDLRDSADGHRCRAAHIVKDDPELALLSETVADRLDELADSVDEVPAALLADYAKAREFEHGLEGPDFIHCSMTMEIGFALDPLIIEDVCRIYIRAVECVRRDPRFIDGGNMRDFWNEFKNAGHA